MKATEQNQTHTPGPWVVDRTDGGHVKVYGPGCAICLVDRKNTANASLIAAAPDLLDALERCRRYGDLAPELAAIVDTAIAKATA